VAETLLEMGELLAAGGSGVEARKHWARALEIFEDLGLDANAGYARERLR
jgi:hypothetical protein